MVNLKVIRGFKDRETNKLILTGAVIQREQDRADELISVGRCELVQEDQSVSDQAPSKKPKQAKNKKS